MRILIKVLLFPVAAALSLTTALFRFMCRFSRGLLSVASGLMFIAALLGLVLPVAKLPAANYAVMFALAFLISPFGLRWRTGCWAGWTVSTSRYALFDTIHHF